MSVETLTSDRRCRTVSCFSLTLTSVGAVRGRRTGSAGSGDILDFICTRNTPFVRAFLFGVVIGVVEYNCVTIV